MLGLILSLAGLGGIGAALAFIPGARAIAMTAVQFIARYPWQAALVAALLWDAWERHDAIRARALTVQWKALHEAGQRNVAALKNAKRIEDARQAANTKRIDDATDPTRSAALAAGDAYARTHPGRLRCPAEIAAADQAGGNLPGGTAVDGRAEPPAAGSDMVEISRGDFDACTLNSADLGLAYDWAKGLPRPTN
jgi:hypothetical protein